MRQQKNVVLTGSWAPMSARLLDAMDLLGYRTELVGVDDSDALPLASRWPTATTVDPSAELRRAVPFADAVVLLSGVGPLSSLIDDSYALDGILGSITPGSVLVEMTSAAVATHSTVRPFPETAAPDLVPDGLEPMRAAEQRVLAADDWLRPVVVRTGIVFDSAGGPWLQSAVAHAAATGVSRHLGDGTQTYPLVHVDDLMALIDVLLTDDSATGVFHAASEHVSARDLAELVARAAGVTRVDPWTAEALAQELDVTASPPVFDLELDTSRSRAHGWRPAAPRLAHCLAEVDTTWPATG